MSIELLIYLADVLGNFQGVGIALLIISGSIFGLFSFIAATQMGPHLFNKDEDNLFRKAMKSAKKVLISWFVLLILVVFTPADKTIYMMMGAHYIKESSIPPKIERLIEKKLDEYLVDGKGK